MDPVLGTENNIQKKVQDIVEMPNVRDEHWDDEDVAYMRECYGKTMEVLSEVQPESEVAVITLKAVNTFLNWDTYSTRTADEIVGQSTKSFDSQTDPRLSTIEEYRDHSVSILNRLREVFPRDLHTKLGLKKKDLDEVFYGNNDYEKGRRFLQLIRG